MKSRFVAPRFGTISRASLLFRLRAPQREEFAPWPGTRPRWERCRTCSVTKARRQQNAHKCASLLFVNSAGENSLVDIKYRRETSRNISSFNHAFRARWSGGAVEARRKHRSLQHG